MACNIPVKVYDTFNKFVKDHLERTITLFFPSKLQDCPNCYQNTLLGIVRSASIYRETGPMPFAPGMTCPYCGGKGALETEVSEIIPSRIYWKKSDFISMPISININSTFIQTYTNMIYLPQIEKASYIIPNYDGVENFKLSRYYKKSPSYPEGLKDNPIKYVITLWGTDVN